MTSHRDSSISLEQLGWRQFSVITGSDLPVLSDIVTNYADDDVFIVMPYSCAVVQMNFEKEPYVELYRSHRVNRKNRGLQFGRSPRELQLEMSESGKRIYVNGSIHDRFFVGHEYFLELRPRADLELSDNQRVVLKNWFAKRYLRNAFPAEFNNRAGSVLKGLQDTLKSSADIDDLLGVYIELDPKDQEFVEIDDVYEVNVCFLIKESLQISGSLITIKDSFSKVLSECAGISVAGVELRTETDILLSEFRRFVRIDDYDFISFRDDHDGPQIG